MHEATALFETARTNVKAVHKDDDRQRLKQLDVALQTMATQSTRELRRGSTTTKRASDSKNTNTNTP